jgi:hypothetical protein
VQVIGWWDSACDEPLYLVTNLTDRDEGCRCYQKRMLTPAPPAEQVRVETLFLDQKSRGFGLNQCHLSDPERPEPSPDCQLPGLLVDHLPGHVSVATALAVARASRRPL